VPGLTFSVESLNEQTFQVSSLKSVHAVICRPASFFNKPVFLPRAPTDTSEVTRTISSLLEEFTTSFSIPERTGYVFNIAQYSKERERFVVANAVFEETGFACVNGSDTWSGSPFTREEILSKISNAFFVIADLSGLTRACLFEVGVAVGSRRNTFLVTNTPKNRLPFGVDRLPNLSFANDSELDAVVRVHCRPYRRRVFNVELRQQAPSRQRRELGGLRDKKVLILVHGIRTQGEWQEMVRDVFQASGHAIVVTVKYGFLDVLRFWCPIWTRDHAVATLKWKFQSAISTYRDNPVVVIAHSFGTFAVTKILSEDRSFRPSRIIFCGSIVPQNFRWDEIPDCPEILNDCGGRDIWPVLAATLSWGYGPSGTFGFGTPGLHDRYHDFHHSDYFNRDFVERFWVPWVNEAKIVGSQFEMRRRLTPYWTSLLAISSLRLIVVVGVLLLAYRFLPSLF
jgi:hypothetical protein